MTILEPLKGIITGDLGTSLKHVHNIASKKNKFGNLFRELTSLNCLRIVKKNLNFVLAGDQIDSFADTDFITLKFHD